MITPQPEDCGSHWRLNLTCDHGRHQELYQSTQQKSITEELQLQPAPGSETVALPTNYDIIGPGIDIVLADMYPEIHKAMPVDMNNRYLVSNTGAPQIPDLETSTITFVQLRSNEWHASFHTDKNSMLHHGSLQSIFDDPSHIQLLNKRHSQSRRQWLRAKGNKIPTTGVPKCSIARSYLCRSTWDDLLRSCNIKSTSPTTFCATQLQVQTGFDIYSLTNLLALAN